MKELSFEEEKQKLIEVSELYQNFGDNTITCDEFNSFINLLDELDAIDKEKNTRLIYSVK
jgi:predicted KAP-like P-loop ATPase